MAATSYLTATQRYAAGALFGLALHQAQLHQTHPLGLSTDDFPCESESPVAVSEDPNLWAHHHSALLRPVFKYLDIDSAAWSGLEETAGSASATRHVGPFLRLLSEELDDDSSQRSDQELALSEAVDAMVLRLEMNSDSPRSRRKKLREYEHQCREKFSTADAEPNSEKVDIKLETQSRTGTSTPFLDCEEPHEGSIDGYIDECPVEEVMILSYQRKLTVLYELLSACLSDLDENNKKYRQRRKGYDARHRVSLRLLATWLDIKWTKMEAIETLVSSSAMAFIKEQESSKEETQAKESKWAKWKRGGIIGAAALTGGTLMAITGGLAAPAIAAGLGALAPTLGTLIPVIGASGFAAAASAAGTVAGSVAVAASFGAAGAGLTGTKMARRVGDVDEFEFKAIGENHNQGRLGVEIMISGFIFEDDDFIRPWEGLNDNLERYALQWESKNLIALSTAIQNWLTSRIATELMKQGAMMTVMHALLTALAWPAALFAATEFIDSIWTIAIDRTDKAGKLLAEVLLGGLQGNRPVTLVGYSLGARVIFKCLEFLAETENSAELVERVVLLGAPIAIKDENWEAARKMVAGRFVNAYSRNDWMLGVAFRASLLSQGLAGIQPVDIPGIQNVDVTDHIEGHSSYLWATPRVLDELGLDSYYPVYNNLLS
ncbi:transmembrane and coiled-coil domain-containing protein 4 [Cajanus cajan]|uniref:Membrane protein F35D11.3 n=1 Tax=Cajanus cajan TaxID=3821 RepID=A0A151TIT5_CAJCA|nr:transmembrane and coiled-coil domain-containing protein 4 [Cajanus cajan]KYP66896.1 putative membrane protein F35D11.3 [Cajanus cajan]